MPIKDLGITDDDLSKQYQYTKDIVTDSKGVLKGLSWQGCPGVPVSYTHLDVYKRQPVHIPNTMVKT